MSNMGSGASRRQSGVTARSVRSYSSQDTQHSVYSGSQHTATQTELILLEHDDRVKLNSPPDVLLHPIRTNRTSRYSKSSLPSRHRPHVTWRKHSPEEGQHSDACTPKPTQHTTEQVSQEGNITQHNSVATTTSNMPSRKYNLCDEKVRFKGRFCTDALNEVTMAKLTAAVSQNKGKKTRLKLSRQGISCGQKLGTLLRNKIAYEFKHIRDIEDIVVDQLSNLLLIIIKLRDGNYEIMAFEGHPDILRRFEGTFVNIKNLDASSTNMPEVHVTDNWTLRQTNKPVRPTVLNMYTPQSQLNGTLPNSSEMPRSRSVQDFSTRRRTRSRSRDDGDGLSDVSGTSAESMKREILNLSREVHTLKSMLDNGGPRSVHDNESVLTSASGRAPNPGGLPKNKVTDYRRQNGTSLHIDTVDNNVNYATGDRPIHLVYRREGERSGSPLRYRTSSVSTMHTQRTGDPRYRAPDTYSYRDNASLYSSNYQTSPRRLVTPVPIGPARVYGAAVGPVSDGSRTVYKTKSMESPGRWRYRDAEWEGGSVYSSRTYTAPSRQPRTLERKIYTAHPDFSYVNIVPTRSQSTSRYESRRSDRW